MSRNIYLAMKHCTAMPSAEEARRLIREYRAGDMSARDALITGNLPMVIRLIKSFRVPRELHDDAFSEGVIGLMRAIEKYDPDHPSQAAFASVAYYWIMQRIQFLLRRSFKHIQHETPIGIDIIVEIEHEFLVDNVDTEPLLARLNRRERKALEHVTMGVTLEFVAAEMGVSKERVRQIRNNALDKLRRMMR